MKIKACDHILAADFSEKINCILKKSYVPLLRQIGDHTSIILSSNIKFKYLEIIPICSNFYPISVNFLYHKISILNRGSQAA